VLDANGDGVIDADEIANAPAALKKLDKNGDGQLTPDEYMPQPPEGTNSLPPPPEGPDGKRPVPPIVAALDNNGDGIIDANEIANASASLLKLDKNGDGKLTPNEYRPHPPGHRGPPPDDADGPPDPPPGQ
jgi:Ca2+-binding EF-hand superfamily protein